MDPVSGPRRDEDGIPRLRQVVAVPRGAQAAGEDWRGANQEKAEKLRRNDLKLRARTGSLELRHSDHGYALIDTERKLVDDRNDMTLDEIESWLDRAVGP